MQNHLKIKKLLLIVSFSAIAIIVGFIEIPLPFAMGVKLDLSEVIVLIGYLFIGFKRASIIIILRSLIRALVHGFDPLTIYGEFMAVYASFVLLIVYIVVERVLLFTFKNKKTKVMLIESICTPIFFAFFLVIMFSFLHITATNYIYGNLLMGKPFVEFNDLGQFLSQGWEILIIPYALANLIKGLAVGIIFVLGKPIIMDLKEIFILEAND